HEDIRKRLSPFGGSASALGDVLGVIARQEEQLGRRGDRNQQPDLGGRNGQLVALEDIQPLDPGVQLAGCLVGRAVRRQEVEKILGGWQQQLHAVIAAVRLRRLVERDYHVLGVKTGQDHLIEPKSADSHPASPSLVWLVLLIDQPRLARSARYHTD